MCKVNDEQEVNYVRIVRCTFMYKQFMFWKILSISLTHSEMYSKHYVRKMLCLATYIVIITRENRKFQSKMEYDFT